MAAPAPTSPSPDSGRFLYWLAVVFLVLGLGIGGWMYWQGARSFPASDDDGSGDPALGLLESKKLNREVEMYSGKMGVLMVKWEETLEAWKQPKPMGLTIMIVGAIAAAGCYELGKMRQRALRR